MYTKQPFFTWMFMVEQPFYYVMIGKTRETNMSHNYCGCGLNQLPSWERFGIIQLKQPFINRCFRFQGKAKYVTLMLVVSINFPPWKLITYPPIPAGTFEVDDDTLPKTNISPKNGGFQKESPFPGVYLQGLR